MADQVLSGDTNEPFVIMLMLELDDSAEKFLQSAKDIIKDEEVHEACIQPPGTYHFTLCSGLTGEQAESILNDVRYGRWALQLLDKHPIDLGDWNSFTSAACLAPRNVENVLNPILKDILKDLQDQLNVTCPGKQVTEAINLHMSVYRMRAPGNYEEGNRRKEVFNRCRDLPQKIGRGSVLCTSIVLKRAANPYDSLHMKEL
jgi:hypothetical protein